MAEKKAIIFGSTGLTGGFLLQKLLEHPTYTNVKSFVRSKTLIKHPKLTEFVVNMNEIQNFAHQITGDDLFLCLGTTIKKAGSKEVFVQIDYSYNLHAAEAASQNGVKACYLVSAIGADAGSSNFYSSVKGKLEDSLIKLSFQSVGIFRPSLLLGKRKEIRVGEKVGVVLSFLFTPLLRAFNSVYTPVDAANLAECMIRISEKGVAGIHFYAYKEFKSILN